MDQDEQIRELQHRFEQEERLHEANMKSLVADLKTARFENDKIAEKIGDLEDLVDVQTQRLEIAEKHLSTVKSKSEGFALKCTEKEEQIERLGSSCHTAKKKLQYTESKLQVAREEIQFLRAHANLDASFEAQVNTTDDPELVQETISTVAALAEKAARSDEGAAFITTVKPKDLPECWGVRFPHINLPGYSIDLQAIKEELHQRGKTNRRGVFKLGGGQKKQLRCTLVPKY